MKPERAFAAHNGMTIVVSTTRFYAGDARASAAAMWDAHREIGWKKAKKHGWRIVKVTVSLTEPRT